MLDLLEPFAKGCLPFRTDIGTGDLSGELRGCRGAVGLSLTNSQKGWFVNLAAEHGPMRVGPSRCASGKR